MVFQGLFVVVATLLSFYFLKRKRRLDIVSVAFFSCLFFFVPGFMGQTALQIGWTIIYEDTIHNRTYIIFILAMSVCLMVSLVSDRIQQSRIRKRIGRGEFDVILLNVAVVAGIASFAALLVKTDFQALTEPNKRLIFESGGIAKSFHSAFRYCFGFSLLLAYLIKKKRVFGVCCVFLLIDIYMGYRSVAAVAVIGLTLLYFRERKFDSRKYWREIVLVILFVLTMHVYKDMYQLVKGGKYSEIIQRVKSVGYVEHQLYRLPGYVQASILNECVYRDFRIPADHFNHLVEVLLPINITGREIVSFNERFQWELFPSEGAGGLAANPYAEFYSWRGMVGVLIFLLFNGILLLILNYLYECDLRSSVLSGITFVACFHGFYMNRSSLFQILIIERRFLMLFAGIYLISIGVYVCLRGMPRNAKEYSFGRKDVNRAPLASTQIKLRQRRS